MRIISAIDWGGFLEGFEDADGEAAQAGDVFRAEAGADATAVLIEVPVIIGNHDRTTGVENCRLQGWASMRGMAKGLVGVHPFCAIVQACSSARHGGYHAGR